MESLDRTRAQAAEGRAALSLRQCRFVVLRGNERGREYVIASDVIRVGKADENDLVLKEETVSRVHFEIVRDSKGYLVRDLRSTNGTFLDGAEVKEAYLRPGSVIAAGAAQLRFVPFEEPIEVVPSDKEALGELVGRSPRMREIFALVERIAPTEATVLLEGEAGTGKELVARTIHALSRRRSGPFVIVDCAAALGTPGESELFGHERGAFTGAGAARQGAFEVAQGGTLFLAEVGELSLDLQAKLIRVLEQREVRRLGGTKMLKLDTRVIAASRRPLAPEVEKGKLREELYFRLSAVPIALPPLRDRLEDVPALAFRFASRLGEDATFVDESMEGLQAHDWPGNVRELRQVVERGLGRAAFLVPPSGEGRLPTSPGTGFDPELPFREQKERWSDEFERRYLTWLLARTEGNISKAARDADMDRKYLHKLLKKHGIVSSG